MKQLETKMKASILVALFLGTILNVKAVSAQQNALMYRMLGFQYPLDATSNYTLGWTGRWDAQQLEYELQTIRSNFTHFNLLRIAITWYEMNETILLDHIQDLLDLGRKYDFKFLLYLMDRTGGTWPNLTPANYLEANWADHENRIRNVLERFRNDNQIYAWGLENEANVFQEVQTGWFEHFIPFMKGIDLDTPICTSFYSLGLNSSTISRCQEIASFGLDFIEYHHYATIEENIAQSVDWFTSYVKLPIFVSEFSVYGGLSRYNTTTNQRILKSQIQEWEKRPNVIGMSYYRFSNDTDPWTIWNKTFNSMKAEGIILTTYAHEFMKPYPYAYLYNLQSANTSIPASIYDPSFESLIAWPDRKGWITSHNHTMFDLKNITTNIQTVGSLTNRSITNFDFEQDFTDWNYWPQTGPPDQFQWKIVDSPTYSGNKALKLWANTTGHNDTQAIQTAMSVIPENAYFVQAWIKVESVNLGAYAFISINFRNSTGAWIEWSECEYVNATCDWTQLYVGGIAPKNVVDMVISLRTRASDKLGQSVIAYFDHVTMKETTLATYDGKSYAMAWGRGWTDVPWNFAEALQSYRFLNAEKDVQKLWTFKCRIATVQSDEYTTDWKGCFITLAFTTSNPDRWISWHDSKYLSLNHQFTELEVAGIPPADAKGLVMIIKVSVGYYGVMLFDDAQLYSQPIVVPQNFSVSGLTGTLSEYDFDMNVGALNNTKVKGFLYGGSLEILSSNVNFSVHQFSFDMTNFTTRYLHFRLGIATYEPWTFIIFFAGVFGIIAWIITPFWVVNSFRRKNYRNLLLAIMLLILATACLIIWLSGII